MPNIVIVALNINRQDEDFSTFDQWPAIKKLEWLENRVIAICEDLKIKAPEAAWIICWREYGMTNGPDKRAVSSDIKTIFKKKMLNLTQQYPNVIIVAGTLSTAKHYEAKNEKKLDSIKAYYAEHGWIKEEELKVNLEKQQQISIQEKKITELKTTLPEAGFDVVRNTCYVFSGGFIWRHDKMAPMEETNENCHLQNSIFQPAGSIRNLNSLYAMRHPIKWKHSIIFQVEICREHEFGVLKKTGGSKPLIHFILSDSTDLKLEHIHGEYTVQLDSMYKPRLILSSDEKWNEIPIHFYQSNLIKDEYTLSGPLQPVYPFEKKVLNAFDSIIPLLSGNKLKIMEHIKQKFIEASLQMGGRYSIGTYDCLTNLFDQYKAHLKNDYLVAGFFITGPDVEKMVKDLLLLVKTERINNPLHKDYLAMSDALSIEREQYLAHTKYN